jgi:hypothetical protein
MPRIGLGYGTRARFQTTGHCWQSPLEGDGELCSLATSSAHARHSDKFYLLTSVFVEYDERVEVGGKAS